MLIPKSAIAIGGDAGSTNQLRCLADQLLASVHWLPRDLSVPRSKMREHIRSALLPAFETADVLITGTSWRTRFEAVARSIADEEGFPSWGYLDHWTEMAERFTRWDEDAVPDRLLVPDIRILINAHSNYPETPIVLVPNFYIEQLVQQIRHRRIRRDTNLYIFIGEPQRRHGIVPEHDGDMTLLALKKAVISGHIPQGTPIHVRPHPSQVHLISDLPGSVLGHEICVLERTSLVSDLSRAQGVYGFESFALEIAASSGILTYSALEPGMPQLELLHPSVIGLPSLVPESCPYIG